MGQASVLSGLDSSSSLLTGPSASALVLTSTPLLPQQPEWALLGHELDGVTLLPPGTWSGPKDCALAGRVLCNLLSAASVLKFPRHSGSAQLHGYPRNTRGTFYLRASVPPLSA